MIHEMPADDVPVVFSARAWKSSQESWDDYIRALERAYAQYVERARGTMIENQTRCAPDPENSARRSASPSNIMRCRSISRHSRCMRGSARRRLLPACASASQKRSICRGATG